MMNWQQWVVAILLLLCIVRQEPQNEQNALSRNTWGICCLLTFSNLATLPFGAKIVRV